MEAPADLVAFVEREQPRLVRAVDLLLGDRAVAEEITQEALLRAASRWEKVRSLGSPGGWTHRVAINLATSQLRRRRVERRARARMASQDGPSWSDAPTEHDPEQTAAVRRALARLSAADRRRLVLRHVLDWSAEEIGDLEGASAATVRQRLHRARQALRDELTSEAPSLHLDLDDDATDDDPRPDTTTTHEETSDVR